MKGTGLAGRFVLLACFAAFAMFKTFSLQFRSGDENIYFYLATQVADGVLPYRDFFHAHPPLHLAPLALAYKIAGGFSLLASRLVAIAAFSGACLMLARVGRRPYSLAAVLGTAAFMFSYDVLRLSAHPIGINLAAFWVALAFERLSREKDAQAAAAFCLGGFTMLIAAPAALGATFVLWLANPQRGLRLALYGGCGIALLNLSALVIFGPAYVDQVYLFHFGKNVVGSTTAGTFMSVLQMNGLLLGAVCAGGIALILGLKSDDSDHEDEPNAEAARDTPLTSLRASLNEHLVVYITVGASLFSVLFLLFANRIFVYYFQVLFVCLVPIAGYGLAALAKTVHASFDARESAANELRETRIAASVLLLVLFAGQLPGLRWGEGETEKAPIDHRFASSGNSLIDGAVRASLWRDVEQPNGNYTGLTRYLWNQADWFESAEPIAKEVRRHCGPSQSIFGDSNAAPLVALMADRKLALGEADTNQMRFASDAPFARAFIETLEEDPPCAVVYRENHGVFVLEPFSHWLRSHYETVFESQNHLGTRRFRLLVRGQLARQRLSSGNRATPR